MSVLMSKKPNIIFIKKSTCQNDVPQSFVPPGIPYQIPKSKLKPEHAKSFFSMFLQIFVGTFLGTNVQCLPICTYLRYQ